MDEEEQKEAYAAVAAVEPAILIRPRASLSQSEQIALDGYCSKYVGLRLVLEGVDENDSWHKISQTGQYNKESAMSFKNGIQLQFRNFNSQNVNRRFKSINQKSDGSGSNSFSSVHRQRANRPKLPPRLLTINESNKHNKLNELTDNNMVRQREVI